MSHTSKQFIKCCLGNFFYTILRKSQYLRKSINSHEYAETVWLMKDLTVYRLFT